MASAPTAALAREFSAEGLISIRPELLRFAKMQLRNSAAAEDLVQESMESAWRGASKFAGQSSLKSWVFAILRNRMADHIRESSRTVAASTLVTDDDDWQQSLDTLFNEHGAWRAGMEPKAWPEPDQALQGRQFQQVFDGCLKRLPAQTGRVFMMRELLDFDTDEICTRLGLSISNVHVILHRARLKLRACMQLGWGHCGCATC